jgi:hypothetical protein
LSSWLPALVWLAGASGTALPVAAQEAAFLPEPDITYFGSAPAGSEISIERASDVLDSDTAGAANPYVLIVKVLQPVVTPTPALPPDGTAYVGDMATVLVNGVAQGRVNLEERGAIFRLDIPNPARTPSPNAILTPERVVSTVPPFACGDVTCTPTPTLEGTPTSTPTRTQGTGTPTSTGTPPATPTPTTTATAPTATRTPAACAGNCNGDGSVSLSELVTSVGIAFQNLDSERCLAADRNNDGMVSVDELVIAVSNALRGCPQESP